MIEQNYEGTITICPPLQLKDFFKAIQNPTSQDMQHYILVGERATWPYLAEMHLLTRVELVLDSLYRQLPQSPLPDHPRANPSLAPTGSDFQCAVAVALAGAEPCDERWLEAHKREIEICVGQFVKEIIKRKPRDLRSGELNDILASALIDPAVLSIPSPHSPQQLTP